MTDSILAKAWENPDVFTWVFHLRPSVRFHSGKTLDADDVVYAYQRLLKSSDLDLSSYLTDVAEVRAVDRRTVKIRTKSPLPILLNKLSNVDIIPKDSTSAELRTKENGTGPLDEALQQIMSTLMTDLPWIDVYALENSFSWRPRNDSFVLAYEIGYRE